jgi:hypothetical protein
MDAPALRDTYGATSERLVALKTRFRPDNSVRLNAKRHAHGSEYRVERYQHVVDGVNDAIGGADIGVDDLRTVDEGIALPFCVARRSAFHRRKFAGRMSVAALTPRIM